MHNKLYIIDTLSPFYTKINKEVINWSKIPFHNLEGKKKYIKKIFKKITKQFEKYIKKIVFIGYNSISIDDLAHMVIFDCYPDKLKNKMRIYIKFYKEIFKISKKYGLNVFVNTDIIFQNKHLNKKYLFNKKQILFDALKLLFETYSNIDGVIFRFGESDGVDVKSIFKSKVIVKTPSYLNRLIKKMVPYFEEKKKYLIVRTWTLGAYKIGDLMWNPKTFKKAFSDINYERFVISMKYGEADFFRHLELSDKFFISRHRTIIELQTRREYEGHGIYPNFIGKYYKEIFKKIHKCKNYYGISVWCQTGGWSPFINRTFLKKSSIWNEINTYTTIKLFRDKLDLKSVINSLATQYLNKNKKNKLHKLLKYSEYVIDNLLYDSVIGKKMLYFYRLRLPPLINVFWDTVIVNKVTVSIMRKFNDNKELSIEKMKRAFSKLKKVIILAKELKLKFNYKLYYKTFELIYLIKKMIYENLNSSEYLNLLKNKIEKYNKDFDICYNFKIDYSSFKVNHFYEKLVTIFIRNRRDYRIMDRILFNPIAKFFIKLIIRYNERKIKSISDKRGMSLDFFLK